jgi:hypothetical protein
MLIIYMSNPTAQPFVPNENAKLSNIVQEKYKLDDNGVITKITTLPPVEIQKADRKPGSTEDEINHDGEFGIEEGGKRRIARRSKRTKRHTTHKRKQKKTKKNQKSRRRHQKK